MCFLFFLLCIFWLVASYSECIGGVPFGWTVSSLFVVFVTGFCCPFFLRKNPSLTYLPIYRVPCPLGPSHTVFSCPPVPYHPTRPSQTIHAHPCTSGLVCVCFVVCAVWFGSWSIGVQVVRRCVCRRVWCVFVCVRHVSS